MRLLCLDAELLWDVLRGDAKVTNLPTDGAVLRCGYRIDCDMVEILVEHPSFEIVAPGEIARVAPGSCTQ